MTLTILRKWVIDEEAAQVVKRIFALCMEGKGPSQIAALLEKEKVLNPTAYKQREGRKTPHQTPENEYRWHESTVAYILEYMEYTGCTVNFKTYTNSIWDKKQRENPMENRKIFYNTHPAIISLEVFDKVQEIRQQRHRRTATGKSNMFSGLVFCNDCKQKLYYSTTIYFEISILKSGRTSLSAPPIVPTRTSAADIISACRCAGTDRLEAHSGGHIGSHSLRGVFPFRDGAKAPYAERGIAAAVSKAAGTG